MNEDKRKGLARETLSIYIAEHHLRSTPERFAVLDKVLEMPSRFTVDELITAMEGGDFSCEQGYGLQLGRTICPSRNRKETPSLSRHLGDCH